MTKILWTLMDNRRGSVNQALGIIDALDKRKINVVEKTIEYTTLSALPNWLRGKSLLGITENSKQQICAPYPDYVLSVSRRTAPIARYIKKLSPSTMLIQLMHPGNSGLSEFSLVIVPEHDRGKKYMANVHYIVGCPHRITQQYLQEAKQKWQSVFADLPRPLTAVIVGGSIKGKAFPLSDVQDLCAQIKKFKHVSGGAILLTTSRRTGSAAEQIIRRELQTIPQYNYFWGDTGENPYAGFLACADNIIITADSVSMCCEATGTGKPIYLFIGGKKWLSAKHKRFAQSLIKQKCAIQLTDTGAAEFTPQSALNAATEIAELIEKL